MRFIDLFAGLGGFRLALRRLGHECVFASEIDGTLRDLYLRNFGTLPEGDIREVDISKIPQHEILCAGFPCQPFSKAGQQDGLDDPELGDLYKYILKVVRHHSPQYLILENVPNLEKHDDGQTWEHIKRLLGREGYNVRINKLSPDDFGIPQVRERVYIVGSKHSLDDFMWPDPIRSRKKLTVEKYLTHNPKDARKLSDQVIRCLEVWQDFLDHVPKDEKIPHPLWSMEFGATYPYEDTTPNRMSLDELRRYRGAHGQPLTETSDLKILFKLLPSHAQRDQSKFPAWKIEFIRKNREFYRRHRGWLDEWIPKIREFPSSLQKLEWNCQGEENRSIKSYIIQIRPSGVRVKRRTTAPSLVAMTATQVPIIAWEGRYMTPKECMRLQSMNGRNGLKYLPPSDAKAYEALGNAINVKVAELVARALVGEASSSQNGHMVPAHQVPIMATPRSKAGRGSGA
jgi:DNA (cytosine-5)-methyltransferase 1